MTSQKNNRTFGQKLSFGIFTIAIAIAAASQAEAAPSQVEIIIGRIISGQQFPGQYPGQDQGGYGQMDPREASQLVNLLYQAILFRRADPYALRTNVDRLMQQGPSVLGEIAYGIGASDEFANSIALRYSSWQIVNHLYRVLLGRRGDPSGARGWVSQLEQENYGEVMQGFVESDEFRNLYGL
jgi:hypothetical protein